MNQLTEEQTSENCKTAGQHLSDQQAASLVQVTCP